MYSFWQLYEHYNSMTMHTSNNIICILYFWEASRSGIMAQPISSSIPPTRIVQRKTYSNPDENKSSSRAVAVTNIVVVVLHASSNQILLTPNG